jgi:hypothetical protein
MRSMRALPKTRCEDEPGQPSGDCDLSFLERMALAFVGGSAPILAQALLLKLFPDLGGADLDAEEEE